MIVYYSTIMLVAMGTRTMTTKIPSRNSGYPLRNTGSVVDLFS